MVCAVCKHDLLCDLVFGLTGIGAVRKSELRSELVIVLSGVFDPVASGLCRSMQLYLF